MWLFGCFGFNDFFEVRFEVLLIWGGELRLRSDIQLRAGLSPKGTDEVRLGFKLHLQRGLNVRIDILLPRRCNVLLHWV